MQPSTDLVKLCLDYGALGASFLVLCWALYIVNKVIKSHEAAMERWMGLVAQNAKANAELAVAVSGLVGVVHAKLVADPTSEE